MKPVSPMGLPIGISFAVWTFVGFLRLITQAFSRKKRTTHSISPKDIAVVVPAHNEEMIIRQCIRALKVVVDKKQIYVVSDGSTDKTFRRARLEGCHASNLTPGKGKAKALKHLFTTYKLFERYKFIFIVDADTNMDPACLTHALPLFADKKVGVVFASSQIKWKHHLIPTLGYYFICYRDRLNRMLQYCFVYGQTWKYTNVNYVIPGFATIYRSNILKQLEIDTPGLLIEDFNLAFQFHKKKLGLIGYSPSMIGWDQYPTNLPDYWKQVKRWNIGFFQTVRKNGIWPSMFWLALGVFSTEVILNSLFILFLPLFFLSYLAPHVNNVLLQQIFHFFGSNLLYSHITFRDLVVGVFFIDYCMSVIIGLVNKKPEYLFYGIFFIFMHYITSLILISSLIPGLFQSSNGRWISPTRLKSD